MSIELTPWCPNKRGQRLRELKLCSRNLWPRLIGHQCTTGRMGWMAHQKWKEAKQLPGTAGPGNMLGCCLIFSISCGPSTPSALYMSSSLSFSRRFPNKHLRGISPDFLSNIYSLRTCTHRKGSGSRPRFGKRRWLRSHSATDKCQEWGLQNMTWHGMTSSIIYPNPNKYQ